MSRINLYENNHKLLIRKMIELQLSKNDLHDFSDPNYEDSYLGTEWHNQLISRRLYYNNQNYLNEFDSTIPKLTQSIRMTKAKKIARDFMRLYYESNQLLFFPLDKEYDNRSLDEMRYYTSIDKLAYNKLSNYWSERTIAECIVDTARLITYPESFKHVCFSLHQLYPNIGVNEVFSGFRVVRNY